MKVFPDMPNFVLHYVFKPSSTFNIALNFKLASHLNNVIFCFLLIPETLASLLRADFLLIIIAQTLSYCKHEADIQHYKMYKIVLQENKIIFSFVGSWKLSEAAKLNFHMFI